MSVVRVGQLHVVAARDVAEHDVVHVSKYATATTLAAIILNAMLTAVVQVHLVVNQLIATEDYCWADLPHEEDVILAHDAGGVFLHGQIEWKNPCLVVGQTQVFHLLLLKILQKYHFFPTYAQTFHHNFSTILKIHFFMIVLSYGNLIISISKTLVTSK